MGEFRKTVVDNVLNSASFAMDKLSMVTGTIQSVMTMATDAEVARLERVKSAREEEASHLMMTEKRKLEYTKSANSQLESAKKEQFEKQKKWNIVNAVMDYGKAMISMWSSVMELPFPANVITGGTLSGFLTAMKIKQISLISQQQYANGGVIGATTGPDNAIATVRTGEMILNAQQQKKLFDNINNGSTGQAINITIEGNVTDDQLSNLENMLIDLQSNNRLGFIG